MYPRIRMTILTIMVGMAIAGNAPGAENGGIMIDLSKVTKSNIPNVGKCVTPKSLVFKSESPSPQGEPYFFVAYGFQIKKEGFYRIMIQGPGSGFINYSRYSLAIDNGPPAEALSKRVVTASESPVTWHEQEPLKLGVGNHTLEFRFYPDQRIRKMNRVFAGNLNTSFEVFRAKCSEFGSNGSELRGIEGQTAIE